MKKAAANYEILLFTGNSFSSRQFSSREEKDRSKNPSQLEELEKACWDGMLFEMFPEILKSSTVKCENFIWHVFTGNHFLNISIGPNQVMIERETSIDPYRVVLSVNEN